MDCMSLLQLDLRSESAVIIEAFPPLGEDGGEDGSDGGGGGAALARSFKAMPRAQNVRTVVSAGFRWWCAAGRSSSTWAW